MANVSRSFNMKAGQQFGDSTLFIGDLSYLCNEQTLCELFQVYGPIESIQLKKSEHDTQKNHIGYGFITFASVQSAAVAMQEMNGQLVLGRSIRVGWANANAREGRAGSFHSNRSSSPTSIQFSSSPTSPPAAAAYGMENISRRSKASIPTVQVHVSFTASITREPVTELTIRTIFEQFGDVVDASIKKVYLKDLQGVQSGYGFVHYRLNQEGIQSALQSIQSVHRTTVDYVFYECKETHELKAQLSALQYPVPPAVNASNNRPAGIPYKKLEVFPSALMHSSPYQHSSSGNNLFQSQPIYPQQQQQAKQISSLSSLFSSSFSLAHDPCAVSEEVKSDLLEPDDFLQGITDYCLLSKSNQPQDQIKAGNDKSLLVSNPFTASHYDCSALLDALISTNITI